MLKKWFENIWYHYKWFIISGVLGAFVLTVVVGQCATKAKYDLSVVVCFTQTEITDNQVELIKQGVIEYVEDYNGDGKVNLNFINCTFFENSKDQQYVMTKRSKLQISAMGESSAILYITDDKAFQYIDDIMAESGGFFDNVNLPEHNGKALKISGLPFYSDFLKTGDKLPQNLYISKRVIKGTLIEAKDNVTVYEDASDKFLESLTKATTK